MVKSKNQWNFQCRVLRSKKWQSLLFQKLRAKVKQTNLRGLSEGCSGSRLGLQYPPCSSPVGHHTALPLPYKDTRFVLRRHSFQDGDQLAQLLVWEQYHKLGHLVTIKWTPSPAFLVILPQLTTTLGD